MVLGEQRDVDTLAADGDEALGAAGVAGEAEDEVIGPLHGDRRDEQRRGRRHRWLQRGHDRDGRSATQAPGRVPGHTAVRQW